MFADFFADLWNDHYVLGILSGIPGLGIAPGIRNIQLYDMEGDHYNKILAEILLVANIGTTAMIAGFFLPAIELGAGIVASVCMVTSVCAGVAVTGFNFGNKLSYAIDDLVETGQVSAQTKGAIKSAGLDFGLTFAGGIVGASAIDDAMRVAKAGSSVKFSGGSKSGSNPNTYYHSCADEVADIIADTGFRTDLPNEVAAFHNNRYGRGVYLADSPATALAERPGGTILKVSGNPGKNLDITSRGVIGGDDYTMTHAIARGARKHGFDSITFMSAKNPDGVNTVIFNPANVRVEEILR